MRRTARVSCERHHAGRLPGNRGLAETVLDDTGVGRADTGELEFRSIGVEDHLVPNEWTENSTQISSSETTFIVPRRSSISHELVCRARLQDSNRIQQSQRWTYMGAKAFP